MRCRIRIASPHQYAFGANNAIAGQCTTIATNVTLSAANSTLFCLIPYNSDILHWQLGRRNTIDTSRPFHSCVRWLIPCPVIVSEFLVALSFAGESGSITDHTYITVGQGGVARSHAQLQHCDEVELTWQIHKHRPPPRQSPGKVVNAGTQRICFIPSELESGYRGAAIVRRIAAVDRGGDDGGLGLDAEVIRNHLSGLIERAADVDLPAFTA